MAESEAVAGDHDSERVAGESVVTRLRDGVRGRAALVTFAAIEVIAFPILLVFGRHEWFTADDWDFLSARTVGNVSDLFRAHFQHWTTLPILEYRLLFNIFGLHTYVPYLMVVILAHLTVVALLRIVMLRAGVRPWVATIIAALLVFFGAGAENILVAFQIAFVGSLMFGLTQLLLADHDGPLDRRDRWGLLAGFAALMCSGVGVAMAVIVGLAILLRRGRRGWRAALFHTAPLGLAYLIWSNLSPAGQSAGVYKSQSVGQVVKFIVDGVKAAFGGLERLPELGIALGVLMIIGLAIAYRARGLRALRRGSSPLIALLVGALVFLVITGVVRSGQPGLLVQARATGPARARESRYLYLIAAMVLPAVALAVDTVIRRWRRIAIPILALPLIGVPGNVRALENYKPYYATMSFERAGILSLPHSQFADQLRHSRAPVPFPRLVPEGLTLGWIVDSHAALPSPGPFGPREIRSQTLRFMLQPSVPDSTPRCVSATKTLFRVLDKGATLTIELGNVNVADQPVGRFPSQPEMLVPATYTALVGPIRLRLEPDTGRILVCS